MTNESERNGGVSRRTLLKASTAGAGAIVASGVATAGGDGDNETVANETAGNETGDGADQDAEVDEPDGFEVEILQEHAPFPDELAATFSLSFDDADDDGTGWPIGAHARLDDESTMIVAEVTWEPGGTSGWHRHPGVVLVSMIEGEVEVTWERDCVPHTYAAGEGFFDPGIVHNADNLSDGEGARAYAVFLGIPDGAPATEWVEPVEC